MTAYRRRSSHRDFEPLPLDMKDWNYTPTYRPNWWAIGCGAGVWVLIGQVVRWAIQ